MRVTFENYDKEIDAIIEAKCEEIYIPFDSPETNCISLYHKSNGKAIQEELERHGWVFGPWGNKLYFDLDADHEGRDLFYASGLEKLRKLCRQVEDYPLLDEDDYYESIREEAQEVWDNCGMAYEARTVLHKLILQDVLYEAEHPEAWRTKMFDVIDCIDEDNNEGFKVLMDEVEYHFIDSYEENCDTTRLIDTAAEKVYISACKRGTEIE